MTNVKNGYIFTDTFNDRIISTHRLEERAVEAAERFHKQFSGGSYLPTELIKVEDGEAVETIDWDRCPLDGLIVYRTPVGVDGYDEASGVRIGDNPLKNGRC